MIDWSGRIDAGGLQGELRRVLTDAVDALPTDYRAAVVLHDVEGVSDDDIAGALGIGLEAVRARVHRSRLFLRKRLSNHLDTAVVIRADPRRHSWRPCYLTAESTNAVPSLPARDARTRTLLRDVRRLARQHRHLSRCSRSATGPAVL